MRSRRPPEECPVCIQGAFAGYISWEQFLENRRQLRTNCYRQGSRGAPRRGAALLQGIALCGRCGSRMRVRHYALEERRSPTYVCDRARHEEGAAGCQDMRAIEIDRGVTDLFLGAVTPARVEIALRAVEEWQRDRQATRAQWELQEQRAEYEVGLARRRFEPVDPENRLVAGELERQWEESMRALEGVRRGRRDWEQGRDGGFGPGEREHLKGLSADLGRVWRATTTSMEERKTLLRFLVRRVHLDGESVAGKLRIDVEWHTGSVTTVTVDRSPVGIWNPRKPEPVVRRIAELRHDYTQAEIAEKLNAEGFVSAKGKPFTFDTVGWIIRRRGWGRKGAGARGRVQN